MLVFVATIAAGDVQTSCETYQFLIVTSTAVYSSEISLNTPVFLFGFFPIKTAGDVPTSCQNHPVVGSCLYPAVSHLQKLKPQTRSLTYLLSYSYKLTWAYQLLAETLSANVLSWRLRLSSAWWWFILTWKMDFGVYPRMNTDPFKCFKPNRLQTI